MNFRDQDERSKKRETKRAELSNMTFFGLIVARPKNSNTKALSALALQRATFVILKGAIRSCPHYQRRPLLSQAGVTLILLTRARHRAALPGCSLCFINVSSYATSRRAPITPSRSINFSLSLSLSLSRSRSFMALQWPRSLINYFCKGRCATESITLLTSAFTALPRRCCYCCCRASSRSGSALLKGQDTLKRAESVINFLPARRAAGIGDSGENFSFFILSALGYIFPQRRGEKEMTTFLPSF